MEFSRNLDRGDSLEEIPTYRQSDHCDFEASRHRGRTSVPELHREHGISSATFYKWRSKYGGMEASMVSGMKELEEENRRLKKVYAEAQMSAGS